MEKTAVRMAVNKKFSKTQPVEAPYREPRKAFEYTVILLWIVLLLCVMAAVGYALYSETKIVDREREIIVIEDGPELRKLKKAALENIGGMK